jgi:flagellar basal-body rod modification protein FlgD
MSDINAMNSVGVNNNAAEDLHNSLSGNQIMGKDDFLKLLVNQLKYQDPINPMGNTEFASQLAQFSQLESLQQLNTSAENQIVLDQSLNNSFMINLIGKDVEAYGNQIKVNGGNTEIKYSIASKAEVKIKIYNEDGTLIKTIDEGKLRGGEHKFSWDGMADSGLVANGNYRFEIEAKDGDTDVTSYGIISGTISGISYDQGSPYIIVNGETINLGDIISVNDGNG